MKDYGNEDMMQRGEIDENEQNGAVGTENDGGAEPEKTPEEALTGENAPARDAVIDAADVAADATAEAMAEVASDAVDVENVIRVRTGEEGFDALQQADE